MRCGLSGTLALPWVVIRSTYLQRDSRARWLLQQDRLFAGCTTLLSRRNGNSCAELICTSERAGAVARDVS